MKNMMLGVVLGMTGMYGYTKYKDGTIKRFIYNIKPMLIDKKHNFM